MAILPDFHTWPYRVNDRPYHALNFTDVCQLCQRTLTMLFLVLGVLEERLRVCWASQEAQWHTIDTNLDVCGEISMFKRQAEMNYATKYKSLPAYGMQSSKALMKVSTIGLFLIH